MVHDNYYNILGIPAPSTADDPSITPETLKAAYRRALLQHHPDRKSEGDATGTFTVDQIIEAYETLANPASRIKYHEQFLKQNNTTGNLKATQRSALEVVDLEDLQYSDSPNGELWTKPCRCGNTFQINEKQLEEAAADGEVVAGCQGCSLSIRVIFDAVEE